VTLSAADRQRFATIVLQTMASAVGTDDDYPSVHFLAVDPSFADSDNYMDRVEGAEA